MATMVQDETVNDHAARLLRVALPLMTQHDVPVTPSNYAVWYRYVSGADEALRRAIDDHLAHGGGFSPEFNDQLYQRYVLDTNEQMLESVRQSIRALLTTVSGSIDHSSRELKCFVDRLGEHCERLGAGLSENELRDLAHALLEDTQSARESSRRLQRSMRDGQGEATQLRHELERALADAGTDALTGLCNRRALQRATRDLGELAGSAGRLCLVFADIDHFKRINDRYGHLVGDKVLRHVAQTLHRSVKGRDTVCRFGGAEFLVLLPETGYEGALQLCESLRASVEAGRLVRSDTREPIGKVTVSFGVAEWRTGDTLEDMVARADAALYAAKRTGRNRVTGERDLTGQDIAARG